MKMSRSLILCLAAFTVILQRKGNVNAAIQLTATPYLQTFVSHDTYNGTTYYPEEKYSRDWLITGQIPNYTITIEFLACVLETGNNKGVCIGDSIFIYDGTNANSTLIKDTCCGIGDTDPFKVESTDGFMYILFQTDDTIGREGFQISYILEGLPPTTARVTTTETIFEGTSMTTTRVTTSEHLLEGTPMTTENVSKSQPIPEGTPTTTARITTSEPMLEETPMTTARVNTSQHILEGTSMATERVTTSEHILEGIPTTPACATTSTNNDSKLPIYVAVGCAATAVIIICAVCYIIWKKASSNKIKIITVEQKT